MELTKLLRWGVGLVWFVGLGLRPLVARSLHYPQFTDELVFQNVVMIALNPAHAEESLQLAYGTWLPDSSPC